MLAIHPNARTTPAVRAEIARSSEPTGELARRFGVSTETVRKWRKRGVTECRDRSSRPHKLPWKASEEERAVVCALRRATGFPLVPTIAALLLHLRDLTPGSFPHLRYLTNTAAAQVPAVIGPVQTPERHAIEPTSSRMTSEPDSRFCANRRSSS